MPSWNKLSMYQTTITNEGDDTVIRYRGTPIVTFNDKRVVLRTGGWDTVTTRRKMVQASRQFGLGYSVFVRKGVTYAQDRIGTVPLGDMMLLKR